MDVPIDRVVGTSEVERAASGDAAAFDDLIRRRIDSLYRTACAIMGDPTDAWDATQDACLAAWRQLPRLREPDRFDAWLSRILVNACRQRLRRPHRVRELRIDLDLERPGPETDDPANRAETELVSRAFDRLDVDDRSLIVLHHLQHESVASIAATLGVPVGTVKSRLSAARRSLERALENERR